MAAAAEPEPPFKDGYTPIFEDDSLEFYIRQKEHVHQKKFRLEDHLFNVLVKQKTNEPAPLLVGLTSVMEKALTEVLTRLKEYYDAIKDDEEDHQCYLTISEKHFQTGIIVGNYGIQSQSPGDIARVACTRFFEVLNSDYMMDLAPKLNPSLQMHVKVLSVKHTQQKKRRHNYETNKVVVGRPPHARSNSLAARWKFRSPEGYHGSTAAFQDCCLLVSVIFGRFLCDINANRCPFLEKQSILSCLKRPSRCMSAKVGRMVEDELRCLRSKGVLGDSPPYNLDTCATLSALWGCQIVVYSDSTPPQIIQMYPEEIDFSLACIPLFLSNQQLAVVHVDLIKSLKAFINVRGYCCFSRECNFKTTRYDNLRHACKAKATKSCFCCHRIVQRKHFRVDQGNSFLFCDAELGITHSLFLPERCPNCNLVLLSNSCKEAHSSICRNKGWACKVCHQFEAKSQAIARETHICERRAICRNCFEILDEDHLCDWSIPKTLTCYENLAFVHFGVQSNSATCVDCLTNERANKVSSCSSHAFGPQREILPNVCWVAHEDDRHGLFSKFCITDHALLTPMREEKNSLLFDYLLPGEEVRLLNRCKRTFRYGKAKGRDCQLEEALARLHDKEEKTVAERFLCKTISEAFRNTTFVVSNYNSLTFILKAMVSNSIIPSNPILIGTKVVCLKVAFFGISFTCSQRFLSGNYWQLKALFDLNTRLSFFPQVLNTMGQKDFILPRAPEFRLFESVTDTEEMRSEKRAFWQQIEDKPWHFVESLLKSTESELDIVMQANLCFVRAGFEFQKSCKEFYGEPDFKEGFLSTIHPFSSCSLAGFIFSCFRHYALPKKVLYCVENQYGHRIPSSTAEMVMTEFLRLKEPGVWETQYSSSKGQRKFFPARRTGNPDVIADAYNAELKTAWFFNGCAVHGCQKCPLGEKPLFGMTSQERHAKFSKKEKLLLTAYSELVKKVVVLWECEYNHLRLTDPELIAFLRNPRLRPVQRLVPQECLKGPMFESYILKFTKRCDERKTFWALDVSSLFPWVSMIHDFPVGKYRLLLGDLLVQSDFTFRGDKVFHLGEEAIGLAQVTVFPPDSLLHPFLFHKLFDQSIAFLCRTCALNFRHRPTCLSCSHSDAERCYVDSYSLVEIAYAYQLGYRFHFHEVMLYAKSAPILKTFVTLLGFEKLRFSKLPSGVETEDQKELYCRELNEAMNFRETIRKELSPTLLQPNAERREFYKQSLNTFLGLFSANLEKTMSVDFVYVYEKLRSYYLSGRIVDLTPMSLEVLMVTLSNSKVARKANRKSNVPVGIYVTSISRIFMHKHLTRLHEGGADVMRISCDCLYFALNEEKDPGLTISEAFGCFKHAFSGEILHFVQMGVKNYSLVYRDAEGRLHSDLTTSGIGHSDDLTGKLTHDVYNESVEELVKGNLVQFRVHNVRNLTDVKQQKVEIVRRMQSVFSRNLYMRRQISTVTHNYATYPHGYKFT